MKFWEAMKLLEEGKKVRCKAWTPFRYIDNDFDEFDMYYPIAYPSEVEKEWELYEEKK